MWIDIVEKVAISIVIILLMFCIGVMLSLMIGSF